MNVGEGETRDKGMRGGGGGLSSCAPPSMRLSHAPGRQLWRSRATRSRPAIPSGLTVFVAVVVSLATFGISISEEDASVQSHFQPAELCSICYNGVYCELGSAVGTAWYWVPVIVMSAPYGGNVEGSTSTTIVSNIGWNLNGISWSATSTQTNAWSTNASNGASKGEFELTEWTIYDLQNRSEYGVGDTPCTQKFGTQITNWTGWVQPEPIPGTAGQETTTLENSYAFVVTWANQNVHDLNVSTIGGINQLSYATDNDGGDGGCSSSNTASVTQSTLSTMTWGISPSGSYGSASFSGGFSFSVGSGSSTSFTYYFPEGGNWDFDDLGGNSQSALAFSYLPCESGGGCVAYGTPILTPQGYRPVQDLTPGQTIDEYNFTSRALMVGTFDSANSTVSNDLVNVNQGELEITATDQPIFIRNATYIGWLHDPQNLTTADYLFDPVNGSWIPVISVEIEHDQSRVFDVVTSGANNFIANGVLLDIKAS